MINSIKKLALLVCVVLISSNVYAQVPQGFNFQAVARGTDGLPLINENLGVQISVVKGTEAGDVVYTETHSVTSNPVGLIQLVIGEGTAAENSDFSAIDWSSDNYFVKLEIDPAGGTAYEDLGTTRLLSVPYALLAQDVVNGGSSGEFPLDINLNTSGVDTALVINIEGDKTANPLQVYSRSSGFNGAIWGEAISEASNPNNQRGTYGFANGSGTGNHIGVFGGAVNFEATGGSRQALYGQAASKAKYNYGVRALAQGDGSGDIVAIGDEVDGDFGSYNIGGGFYTSGNLNGNVGVEAQTAGDKGSRADFALIARAIGTGNSINVGVRGEANSSPVFNTALEGDASGQGTKNLGLRLNVFNGSSNVGMEVNADTAAILNGDVIINGNLTYAGLSGGDYSTNYDLNTDNVDSSFTVNVSGPNGGAAIISTSSTSAANSGLEAYAKSNAGNEELQVGSYGDAAGAGTGTHIGLYGNARGDESVSGDGGRRYGLYGVARSTGRENIGGFGIGRGAGDGEIVAFGDETIGGIFNVGGFNIGLVGFARDNVNGNIGIRGYVYGDQGGRENRAVAAEAVATATGQNVGVQALVNSSQTKNIGYQALMFDAGSGVTSNENEGIFVDISNSASVRNQGGTLLVQGSSPDNLGLDISVSGGTNSNIGLIVNAETAAQLNGNTTINGNLVVDGFIEHSGSITQTSDGRLKKNIQTLNNALENTLKLRGVSYTWLDETKSQKNQIGVIAQEVEEVYPEFVRTDDEGMKSVNYAQMTAVLIEAVKELNEKIEALENENQTLQAQVDQIDTMKAELSKIWKVLEQSSVSTVTKAPNK